MNIKLLFLRTVFAKLEKLTQEGNFKKYILYAIGEILLIILGILIAIQVNLMNESRKKRDIQDSFVLSILNDVERDRIKLQNIIELQTMKDHELDTLQVELERISPVTKHLVDSLVSQIIRRYYTFFPVIGSYQSAMSDGGVSIFKNQSFVADIIELYDSYYDRVIYNGKLLDDAFSKFREKRKYEWRMKRLKTINESYITELLDDLAWLESYVGFYLVRCEETMVVIDQILENVDNNQTN